MRTLIQATIPTEQGNKGVEDGSMEKIIQETAEKWHPESMYFTVSPNKEGSRTAMMVVDLADSSDIVTMCEPLFQRLGATISMTPVMNSDDLSKGLAKLSS